MPTVQKEGALGEKKSSQKSVHWTINHARYMRLSVKVLFSFIILSAGQKKASCLTDAASPTVTVPVLLSEF